MSVAINFTYYFGDFAVATQSFSFIAFNLFLLSIVASFKFWQSCLSQSTLKIYLNGSSILPGLTQLSQLGVPAPKKYTINIEQEVLVAQLNNLIVARV